MRNTRKNWQDYQERKGENMMYKVLDTFDVGGDTSVTIDGNGEGLKNNMPVFDSSGAEYRLLSVATMSGHSPEEIGRTTTVLIKGKFKSDTIRL